MRLYPFSRSSSRQNTLFLRNLSNSVRSNNRLFGQTLGYCGNNDVLCGRSIHNSGRAQQNIKIQVDEKNGDEKIKDDMGGSSGGIVRLGYGDEAPRYPHLVGLPVITRPVFPGVVTSVNVTDQATINALKSVFDAGAGYVGVFLRRNASVSSGGIIMESPEIITEPDDIYSVGTLAQIHRIHKEGQTLSTLPTANATITGKNINQSDEKRMPNEDDRKSATSVLLMAHRRIDLVSVDSIGPPIDLTVSHWDALAYDSQADSKVHDTIRALSNEIVSTIREVAQINAMFREHIQLYPTRVDANDPYRFADFVASIANASPHELQSVLEERDPESRLHKALIIMKKEQEVFKLQQEISAKVEEKMTEAQRKYFLMEQLKSIKKELGMEQDDKDALLEKYRKKVEDKTMPSEIQSVFDAELEKISSLEKNSSEFNVTRSYMDWLTDIPWGSISKENFDIRAARHILDRDHYGLQDVKDIIMQFIAVGQLKGNTVQGKILCLVGPPGVGKTSIASSIASALNRQFYRFSVGGLSDVSEIKGHRRTYVGAMPGKMIQCLKSCGTMNPLLLIDEIDKLGGSYRGDPASALLEVLDPSQNSSFRDHFLDVPVDMSKVLFMCTANDVSTIPGPLLDRMEIIQLSGYDAPEKLVIADQYLLPKYMSENGLMVKKSTTVEAEEKNEGDVEMTSPMDRKTTYELNDDVPDTVSVDRSAIESLVRWYCREAGVRNLAKHIDMITRKLALQVVAEKGGAADVLSEKASRKQDNEGSWTVTDKNLEHYVGKPKFSSDRLYDKDPLPNGIVMGLAWTSMGGSALYIETQGIQRIVRRGGEENSNDNNGIVNKRKTGGGTLKVTGQLGDVMSESSQIAYTVARNRLAQFEPENSYYEENDIHMHVPEGATPKDGPSAGITMVTAMLSLAMNRPIRHDLAMTGEVSLTGKVLPVGGIREKTMAAKRAGIRHVVFPAGNRKDYEEIPDYLKDDLNATFAEDYNEVYRCAFSIDGQ